MSIIRTLDDITLVPTPVTYRKDGEKFIHEELRAELFTEMQGQPITVVYGRAMAGARCQTNIKFARASITPRVAGGYSKWQLSLRWLEYRKRNTTGTDEDFPVQPVILLKGHHTLDFEPLLPPLKPHEMLVHHDGYGDAWRKVSAYCAEIAGAKAVLIDTTEAAAQWHSKWLPEHRADMARRREWEKQAARQ